MRSVVGIELEEMRARLRRRLVVLETRHRDALACGPGCAGCCVDDLTVFVPEAEAIRERYPELLRHGTPAPKGRCAFLDEADRCRIYDARPYVCRTQGLPLRWLDEDAGAEYRDVCKKSEALDARLVDLRAEDCLLLGPWEAELQTLAHEHSGHGTAPPRVALRRLFEASAPDETQD